MTVNSEFRLVTADDVQSFIQVPLVLDVNATNVVLSTDEDTMKNYEKQFLIMDYVIYSEIPRSRLFDSSMDWKYRLADELDASGVYQGLQVVDAHGPGSGVPLNGPIINTVSAKQYLTEEAASTRFSHYKQCNRFFKYSFKVGDEVTVHGQKAQLYAVYLDGATGKALPYWATANDPAAFATQAGEQTRFFYAAGLALASTLGGAADAGVPFTDPVTGTAAPVTLVCPPHPEFPESRAGACVGGPLAVSGGAGAPVVRQVGPYDASGVHHPLPVAAADLAPYASDAGRELLLYWVVKPPAGKQYLGEAMYASWCSKDLSMYSWGPIRDSDELDAVRGAPAGAASVKNVHRFVLSEDLAAASYGGLRAGMADSHAPGSARRMYMPPSRYVAQQIQPLDPDVGREPFPLPFAYDAANQVDYDDVRKSILGGRVMQIVCDYMFDATTLRELSYFPYILNESRLTTERIIDQLAGKIRSLATADKNVRTDILRQIVVKHGRRYFDEYALLEDPSAAGGGVGSVLDVLNRIDELFLMFTATVVTSVNNRAKDRVEVISLHQLPIVLRVFNDEAPPPPPDPTVPVMLVVQTLPNHLNISWYLDAQNDLSYSGGSTWKDARNPQIVTLALANKGENPKDAFGVPFGGVSTTASTSQVVGFANSGLSVIVFYYRMGSPTNPGGVSSALSNASAPEGGVLLSINVPTGGVPAGGLRNALLLYERYALAYNDQGEAAIKMVAGGVPNGVAADNRWHSRAYTWSADGRTVSAYHNGMLLSSTTTQTAVPLVNSDVFIGMNPATGKDSLNGVIGLYIMYNRELFDYEVSDLHETYKGRFGLP